MNYKKIAVFGCKSTTLLILESLCKQIKIDWVITINEELAIKNEVADYVNLNEFCNNNSLQIYNADKYSLKSSQDLSFFLSQNIDLVFVIGWQRLIPENILKTFSIGAFGMHGSSMDLPRGRGRSPMNWALIEGKRQFYTNLFKYDPGIDSGDILDTYKFEITEFDTAETLHYKNTMAMSLLVKRNLVGLLSNNFTLSSQNTSIVPTYYPKRNLSDSLIDWDLDISALDRFIRAVAPPFNGAFSYLNNLYLITFYSVQVFDMNEFEYGKIKPGVVVLVFPNGKFLVKCFGGLLLVNTYKCDITPKQGDYFDNKNTQIRYFERNNQGYFDK